MSEPANRVGLPPPLDVRMDGVPNLGLPEEMTEAPASPEGAPSGIGGGSRWTPEVVKILLEGLYNAVAVWRGPHWVWTDVEGDPLVDPTTHVFNTTPGLKDLAPEHVALAVVVLGHGTMIAKRAGWDRQLAQAGKQASQGERREDSAPPTESPYGANQLER